MALTSAANVRTRFGTPSADDSLITSLIAGVQAWAERYCGRLFDSAERTLYPSIGGVSTVFLVNAYPIASVASLYASWDTPAVYDSGSLLTEDTDFVVHESSGLVERIGSCWPYRFKQVQITYTGGFSTIPDDLEEATAEVVFVKYRKSKAQLYHVMSESRDDGSFTGIRFDDITPHAMVVFDSYRTPGVG